MTKLNYEELKDVELIKDLVEERAAILEYDAGYSRSAANNLSARMYGFESYEDYIDFVRRRYDEE
jgi:hypothetical protein